MQAGPDHPLTSVEARDVTARIEAAVCDTRVRRELVNETPARGERVDGDRSDRGVR